MWPYIVKFLCKECTEERKRWVQKLNDWRVTKEGRWEDHPTHKTHGNKFSVVWRHMSCAQGYRTGLHVYCTWSCAVCSLHYWPCSEKNLSEKNLIFFCPFSSLFHPCVVVLPSQAKTVFFSFKKNMWKTLRNFGGNSGNVVVSRCGEG